MHETKSDTIYMMQNQPLPKLSVTEVFYSRQVWLYNLTFVITSAERQTIDNCFLYTWLESNSGRGPNEITSILIEFLTELENRLSSLENPPTNLNLFSDSCSAQNKNQYVMAALLHYVNYKTIHFKEIKHYFPVHGHSYMPPDQVFGRIEKSLRNKEVIVSPNTYYEHLKKFTTVNIYDSNFKFFNYKIIVKDLIKTNFFKTTQQKVFSYKSGMKTVGLNDVPELQRLNHVSIKKQDDVRKLMKCFTIPNEAEQFYTNIFKETTTVDDVNDNIEYNEDDYVLECHPSIVDFNQNLQMVVTLVLLINYQIYKKNDKNELPSAVYDDMNKIKLINELSSLSKINEYMFIFKSWQCIEDRNITGKTLIKDITNMYRNVQNPLFAISDKLDNQLRDPIQFNNCNLKNIDLDFKNEKCNIMTL
ncbi:hypothetical protein AGLY_017476 [Aphis glycines]|uniref:DUF7869 domain-containing protein n=1 Tax=Aphis glycines TaxID=307491 RepID=A0A6G0SV39_APHGL|nr:hypothetical protein AGLY_017476 [Aphis glycines]